MEINNKFCTRCNQDKCISEFGIDRTKKDGHNIHCKPCVAEKLRIYRKLNPDVYKKTSLKYRNSEKFQNLTEKNKTKKKEYNKNYYTNLKLNDYERYKEYRSKNLKSESKRLSAKRYRQRHSEKLKQKAKIKRELNREKISESKKRSRLKKIEHYRKKVKEIHKRRLETDPKYRFICGIRKLIQTSISKMNYTKKSKTFQILGCDFDFFKSYIESKFTEGMNWENRGIGEGKWQLDHIVPISYAKDEEEVIKLNHYTNFQPLWQVDNLKKGNKIDYKFT